MNVAAGAGDGDGDGDGDGFGFLTADAEAAEPEAAADQPSRPTVIHSRSEAPRACTRVVICRSPMPRPAGRQAPPGLSPGIRSRRGFALARSGHIGRGRARVQAVIYLWPLAAGASAGAAGRGR